jgi:peptidoglycan/LPS O-acetylase OafA/YrhL
MQRHDAPPSKDQWAILAGLRFFLAVLVVLGHFSLFIRLDTHHIIGDGYFNPGSAVFGFFILSGFSIASSVTRETQGFYRRRFLRIWPLYLGCIAFGLAVAHFFAPHGYTWPLGGSVPRASIFEIIMSVLMLQTFFSYPIAIVGPIWSLSAEWWHYMIAPVIRRLSDAILLIWIVLSFIAFLTILPPPHRGIDALPHGQVFLTSSWLWITGFLYYRLRGTPLAFIVLALPSTFAATLGHFTGAPLFISIFVLVASTEIKVSKNFIKPLNFLGDYSYALYLYHYPAFIAALAIGLNRSIAQLGAAFAVSLIALYIVDYPCRAVFKRRRRAPLVAS